jgi:hypothetical protein
MNHTGDWVRVDGGQGKVEVLHSNLTSRTNVLE